MFSRCLVFALLAALTPAAAMGQTVAVQADRMLDVDDGRMIPDATVLVEDGRIAAVNPEAVPEGAEVVDLGGMTLLPGLIDVNVHLNAPCPVDQPVDPGSLPESQSLKTLCMLVNARRALLAGFTTLRALGDPSLYPEVAYASLATAADEGWIEIPHIVPGVLLFRADAIPPPLRDGPIPPGPELGIVATVSEMAEAVDHKVRQGATVIKVRATGGFVPPSEQTYSAEELRAVVEEAERLGVPVTAHAHGAAGIKAAVRAGVHSIVHGTYIDEEGIELMVERGTWLVPTGEVADRSPVLEQPEQADSRVLEGARHMRKEGLSRHRKALEAGVKFAFGSDAPVLPHGENAREFRALIARGMSPLEAIRTATIRSAELLGLDDRGRIAEGLLADLVAVPSNPLDDPDVLKDVRFVMKGGRVYERSENEGMKDEGLADLIVVDGDPLEDLSALRDVEVVVQGGEVVAGRKERNGAETLPVHRQDWSQVQQKVWEREVAVLGGGRGR